jgi:signal transduction histidine kinase
MQARVIHWRGRRLAGLPVADVVLAAVLCVFAIASAASGNPPEGPRAVTVPVALVMTAALAVRSRATFVALAVVLLAGETQTVAHQSPGSLWAFAVYLLIVYSVAATATEGRAAIGGALVVGALWLQELHDHDSDYLFIVLVFGGAWLLGRAVRHWRLRATSAEQNQDERALEAVTHERARIARELHDLVAHGVSVIAIQADAAEAALDHDPELAREPLRAIKTSSREALDEMRRLLALLRIDDQVRPRRPQPGLGELSALVDSVGRAGLPVTLEIEGTARRLPPGVDLAAYRIVQEGLTNVLKHAGCARTRVSLQYAADAVTVEVTNEKPREPLPTPRSGTTDGSAGGHGLVGIRERTAIVGGELIAGPDRAGGFTVRAKLPSGPGGVGGVGSTDGVGSTGSRAGSTVDPRRVGDS